MTKKSRYLLIAVGFIIFILLAPAIVLYVSGITYDFGNKKFVQTGILAVNTEPKTVNVFLDGKLAAEKSGNIKFLYPKDYSLKLQKTGFFAWSKRLPVQPGVVTQAAGVAEKIFLLRQPPLIKTFSQGVLDFATQSDSLAYLTPNELAIGSIGDPNNVQKYFLPKPVNNLTFSPDAKMLVLSGPAPSAKGSLPTVLVFDLSKLKFTDLSQLFTQAPQIKFSGGGQPFALENQILYKLDLQQPAKTEVLNNVSAFTFQDDNLYYIQNNNGNATLEAAQLPSVEGLTLAKNLPTFAQAQIFVSFTKSVMLLLDNTLYQVNTSVDPVVSNISQSNFNLTAADFVFFHDGDLNFYNPTNGGLQFITRSSAILQNPVLKTSVNYVFAAKGKTLLAIELDTRDHQNEYELYTGGQLQKFAVDENAQNILVLDGGDLKIMQIR